MITPDLTHLIEYAWMALISTFGGVIKYLRRVTSGHSFGKLEFLVELLTSIFAGMLVYFVCKKLNLDEYTTAASIAIAGHTGGQTIEVMTKRFRMRNES